MKVKSLRLNVQPEGGGRFRDDTSSVWATAREISEILPDGLNPDDQPNYVKIVSLNPLSRFTIYAKIDSLNSDAHDADGIIFVPRKLMDPTWAYDQGMKVEVCYVDIAELPHAETVTVSLNPDDTIFWGDGEVKSAKGLFLAKTGVAYLGQRALVKPTTKDSVMGKVSGIIPRPADHSVAYRVDWDTNLVFQGLPKNKDTAIDFSKIGGLDSVISRLREIVQIPTSRPDLLHRFGDKPSRGVILFGPPGNGKTMIARALAQTMGAAFVQLDLFEVLSKYVGMSERNIKDKFDEAIAAAKNGIGILFIDELDALAVARDGENVEQHQRNVVDTLLRLMDGVDSKHRIFFIGATNRLDAIDPALRRPGRFDHEFEVPLPDLNGRLDILNKYVHLEETELFDGSMDKHALRTLAELTSGFSGADISMLYHESVMHAIRRNSSFGADGKFQLNTSEEAIKLSYDDFLAAVKEITPTQMRGEQIVTGDIAWDDIIGLDRQKELLEDTHIRFVGLIDSEKLPGRPSCANLLMLGRRGSGKRTLVRAFAQKFGYELMPIDCLALDALPLAEAMREIHRVVAKCRQAAPSVLLVQNMENCRNSDVLAQKLVNELSSVGRLQKVLSILAAEDGTMLPACIREYKAFENEISLKLDEKDILDGVKNMFPEFDCADANITGKTIGQIIRDFKENRIALRMGLPQGGAKC